MPRFSREVVMHLEKARESAYLAVETYNRPQTKFRSGAYIVLMCIAWTALFHAIFFNKKAKPFYRKKNHRGRYEVLDGDRKAWELSTCLAEYWGPENPPARSNLDFFIKLRNKIEHRSMPALDLRIFGECQALLFNFEDLLAEHFGERYAINESLSLALQFSALRSELQERSVRKLHASLAKDLSKYIEEFRSSLSPDELSDLRFSYKVFLFPKPANHRSGSDMAVEFVRYDPKDPEAMERIQKAVALIKHTQAPPAQISGKLALSAEGSPVRLTTEADAPAVRAFSPDDSYPYRQKDLLNLLVTLLPPKTRITTHDLLCVRSRFGVTDNASFYYKGKFSSAQYSEDYARWIDQEVRANAGFLEESRDWYRENR